MSDHLYGWIAAEVSDRALLEAMGIVVGPRDDKNVLFTDCEVSPAAMTQLDPLWGQFFWGLSSPPGETGGPARTHTHAQWAVVMRTAISDDLRREAARWSTKRSESAQVVSDELRRLADKYDDWGQWGEGRERRR